jgi:ribonuclease-3
VLKKLYLLILSIFSEDRSFIHKVRNITGIVPGNPVLYKIAFTHRSANHRTSDGSPVNNERLEYLGDAILDAVIADYLYSRFPETDEGFLTQLKSKIVKRKQLNKIASRLGISSLMTANADINRTGKNVLGNAFEALVGAIYLDKGYRRTKRFIINDIVKKYIDLDKLSFKETDFKSRLMEWAQKYKQEISFVSKEKIISGGAKIIFHTDVFIRDELYGEGSGSSKKEAEQQAAEQALKKISRAPGSLY